MNTDPLEASCPECGGRELRWSVRRWEGRGARLLRYFAFICQSCGATWAEPMLLSVDPATEVPHEGDAD